VHGMYGGSDQGTAMASQWVGEDEGLRWIAVSRFGYLGTEIPVAMSAGAPSALQFASSYPDRCWAVVLLSGETQLHPPPSLLERAVFRELWKWDQVYWLVMTLAPSKLIEFIGVPQELQENLTPLEQEWMREWLQNVLPWSMRRDGLMVDMKPEWPDLKDFDLTRIEAPALVIHAEDDKLVPPADARLAACCIPNAKLILCEKGGHALAGHHEEVKAQIIEFLRDPWGYVGESGRQ
jgi:2-hydroxy-6-oxonona-2,4-dienedioate hydrolase